VRVAQAQKTDRWATGEIGGSPQALSWKCPSGLVVNQTNQIDFVGHSCELSADGLQGEEKSAIHDRERSMHSGYSRAKPEVSTLQKTGSFYFALTFLFIRLTFETHCDISLADEKRRCARDLTACDTARSRYRNQ